MLSTFIAQRRMQLILRCTEKVAARPHREASTQQLQNGIPLFLAQLQRTLEAEGLQQHAESLRISGPSDGKALDTFEIGASAGDHGRQLGELGYSVGQVVHDYGDLCQAITDMAVEEDRHMSVGEFRTLNRCLDNAIASAVSAFSNQQATETGQAQADHAERLDTLKFDLRNSVAMATYAVTALEQGNLSVSGATGSLLKRSLAQMRAALEHGG